MRLKTYLVKSNDAVISDMFGVLNESLVPDKAFDTLKKMAAKVGIRVQHSNSVFDYLSKAETSVVELFDLICLYIISNKEEKSVLKSKVSSSLKKIDKQTLMTFFMDMDKVSFGLTSLVRHILSVIFGVNITTYDTWHTNIDYILGSIEKIYQVMLKMGFTEEEKQTLFSFRASIIKTQKEIEAKMLTEEGEGGGGGAGGEGVSFPSDNGTTTGNVAKFWNKIGANRPPERRVKKKKKGLRKLF